MIGFNLIDYATYVFWATGFLGTVHGILGWAGIDAEWNTDVSLCYMIPTFVAAGVLLWK